MRKWMVGGCLVGSLIALAGCGGTTKRVMRPPHIEEFTVAPDGDRFNKPTEYPEVKQGKLKDSGAQLPVGGSGVGGPQGLRPPGGNR